MRKLNNRSRTLLGLVLASVSLVSMAAEDAWRLSAADWSRPRSGTSLVEMPPVAAAVRAWQTAGEDAQLVLAHAGGEEGSLWAAELRDWLIALGVPRSAIVLAPGEQSGERLEIRLRRA